MERIVYFDTTELDQKQQEYMQVKGKTVVDLSSLSIDKIRQQGFQFGAKWHGLRQYRALENLTGARGQVAIDLKNFHREEPPEELAAMNLESRMADVVTYIEIVSKIYSQLPIFPYFTEDNELRKQYIYAETLTPSPLGNDHVLTVGFFQTEKGIVIGSRNKYNKDASVRAIPVIRPLHRE